MKRKERIFKLGIINIVLIPFFVLISFLVPDIGFSQFFYYIILPIGIINIIKYNEIQQKSKKDKIGLILSIISVSIVVVLTLLMILIFLPRGV